MNFHPQKCKVLTISRQDDKPAWATIFPFLKFYYFLNGTDLEFVESEKDLGVIVTSKLSWREQCLALYSKASSRLGLLKRVCHFVKCSKQKRVLYLSLVRSIFEHCVTVWRPCSVDLLQKLESIQRRSVKWILSECGHHYSDFEYLKRLKDLDILPMEYRFTVSDLIIFHKMFYGNYTIKLPPYLIPVSIEDRTRLRTNIRPPNYLNETSTLDLSTMRSTSVDELSLKCCIEPRAAAFKNGFFFRAHLLWNHIPVKIRKTTSPQKFKALLTAHMWDIILAPD